MKKTILLLMIILLNINAFAQTKQEIYCNSDIVWAGIIDMDFVVDADTNTNWKEYVISDLDNWFQQKTTETNPTKTLNELILENVETLQFYEYDSLKYEKHYQSLELSDPLHEPETYGDNGKPFSAKAFNVFRLKCFFYYDKSTLDFKIVPQAVGVLRPIYDAPDEVLNYNILGWLPIEHVVIEALEQSKSVKINDEKSVLKFQFQRDIPFYAAKVFKQEWTDEEAIDDFMTKIRQKAETIELYEPYENEQMDSETIKTLGLDEITALRFDAYEETQEYVPWSTEMYQGIRFSMNWFWNEETKSLSLLTTDFSPLIFVEDDGGSVLGIQALFKKSYGF
ncbi:MAG: hypothetical protein AB8G11_26395 [Saprospiraceae bacterium]